MTDFEKLLYAEGYIRKLKEENSTLKKEVGILKSELQEIKHDNLSKTTKRNLEIKLNNQKKLIKELRQQNKKLVKSNNELIYKLNKAKDKL
jgi:hypothetical protein